MKKKSISLFLYSVFSLRQSIEKRNYRTDLKLIEVSKFIRDGKLPIGQCTGNINSS